MRKPSTDKRTAMHKQLEQVVIKKYASIWGHENTHKVIMTYARITSLTASLDEKGIKYSKDLKSAVKFSPLENAELHLMLEDFKKMVAEASLKRLHRINEDFDLIFMWLDDGYLLKNMQTFIVEYGYKLANFGKRKATFGYDPNYSISSSARPHYSRSSADED